MPLTFIKRNRGKDLLKHNNFVFNLDKIGSEGNKLWKCEEYARKKCRARVHTKNGEVVKDIIREHNHTVNPADYLKREIHNQLKTMAKTTMATTQRIVSDAIAQANTAVAARLPPIPSMKRTAQRARKEERIVPMIPTCLADLIIPQEFREISAKDSNRMQTFL